MTQWILERFAYLPAGVLGKLRRPEGARIVYTIERPWRNNAPYESCIPCGTYNLEPFSGVRHQGVIQLSDVPGRTFILIHVANTPADVQGCIGPGLSWTIDAGGNPRVQQSRLAFEDIMEDFANSREVSLLIRSSDARLDT